MKQRMIYLHYGMEYIIEERMDEMCKSDIASAWIIDVRDDNFMAVERLGWTQIGTSQLCRQTYITRDTFVFLSYFRKTTTDGYRIDWCNSC